MSEALSNLKDHAPAMPSASEVKEAVQSKLPSAKDARKAVKAHVPSIDPAAIADRLPSAGGGKRKLLAMLGALAGAAAVFGIMRRRRTPETSATLYTPPLPKA